ncbi:Polyisoprenoid-binding protein YceI [Mesonia phycicola]|uniref:Polyisoprenoid-binding protein YceI n=1 Tax=Mesonia phycicola TaxID=579105 RepID=A0A1M6A2W0_9FLAO|nr:YceI family protein [Mesonia phycicola]SHI30796.1 Polyisoprenoid-binding protein YceI [Mesonia phycicola]
MFLKIKKITFAAVLAILSIYTSNAQEATSWKIDKAHTFVNFSINHFFSSVPGNFTEFDGDFYFDANNLETSKANFTIASNSVNTRNEKRDNHLLSTDFFDAKNYSNITFKSTKFEKQSDKEYLLHGKLTIKNKTKNITLVMKITGEMEHPMMKGTSVLGVNFNTSINRTDYGVGTGDWATTMVVGDEVNINIPMELTHKK